MDFGSFNFAVDEWRHGRTAEDELEQGGTGGRAGGPGPFLRRGRMKIKFTFVQVVLVFVLVFLGWRGKIKFRKSRPNRTLASKRMILRPSFRNWNVKSDSRSF